VKDFPKSRAGQDQEADGGDRERVQRPQSAFWLGRAVRFGLRFIDRPFEARRLSKSQGVTEPREFVARQETLAGIFGIAFDS